MVLCGWLKMEVAHGGLQSLFWPMQNVTRSTPHLIVLVIIVIIIIIILTRMKMLMTPDFKLRAD